MISDQQLFYRLLPIAPYIYIYEYQVVQIKIVLGSPQWKGQTCS